MADRSSDPQGTELDLLGRTLPFSYSSGGDTSLQRLRKRGLLTYMRVGRLVMWSRTEAGKTFFSESAK